MCSFDSLIMFKNSPPSYFLPLYHNSESVEIGSFPGGFPTSWIYGTGGYLGVDLG